MLLRKLGDLLSGDIEVTNLNCTFLSTGEAIITYMRTFEIDGAFNRDSLDLYAGVVKLI